MNNLLKLIILFLGCLQGNITHAQTVFEKTYGGAGLDAGYCVRQTVDGGFIVAGRTKSFGSGWPDIYVIKTDYKGDTSWTRWFGSVGTDDESGYVDIISSTNFIIAATFSTTLLLINIDSVGDTLWTKNISLGTIDDAPMAIRKTADGGFIIVTHTYSWGAGSADV